MRFIILPLHHAHTTCVRTQTPNNPISFVTLVTSELVQSEQTFPGGFDVMNQDDYCIPLIRFQDWSVQTVPYIFPWYKKRGHLEIGPNSGGRGSSTNPKSPKFQLGKVQNSLSDMIVYLAIFSITIDEILCFMQIEIDAQVTLTKMF